MNYLYVYNQLIEKRKHIPVPDDEYSESHHIIPKCMGGNDSKENLVRLTAKEHYVAHHLLYMHYKTSKLAHAWFMMLRCDKNQKRFYTSRMYESATEAHSNALKESMKGEGNHFYGRTHTEETKRKIGEANSNRIKSQEEIDNWVEKVASKPKSDEHRKKIGRKGMITLQSKKTGEIIRILKEDANELDHEEWVNPRKLKPEAKFKCDHCEVVTTASNLKRWHNDKCKQNPNRV